MMKNMIWDELSGVFVAIGVTSFGFWLTEASLDRILFMGVAAFVASAFCATIHWMQGRRKQQEAN